MIALGFLLFGIGIAAIGANNRVVATVGVILIVVGASILGSELS